MRHRLTIAGYLRYVDDETTYRITAESADFNGTTMVWGSASQATALASALRDFPSSVPRFVDFEFGGAHIGRCALRFETTDGTGHCCVWATLEAEYPSTRSERFEQASICIGFEPAALDNFCADLSRFEIGRANEALLEGHAP